MPQEASSSSSFFLILSLLLLLLLLLPHVFPEGVPQRLGPRKGDSRQEEEEEEGEEEEGGEWAPAGYRAGHTCWQMGSCVRATSAQNSRRSGRHGGQVMSLTKR